MKLQALAEKPVRTVIGLMSGTSADGTDAALTEISGCGLQTRVTLKAFVSLPFSDAVRKAVLAAAGGDYGDSRFFCLLAARLGQLYLEACQAVCARAGIPPESVDLVGCHGQTVWHQPEPADFLGAPVAATFQLGEPSLICERLGAVVVSDFRVRDMAAGGQGAPLVPYSEYLLYRSGTENVALQNLGGIGNITFLPAGSAPADIVAFDTGPGNMLIDAVIARMTDGRARYDAGGAEAARHAVSPALLAALMRDPYLQKAPPKTTGREHYGAGFVGDLFARAAELRLTDGAVLRTVTRYTAETVADAARRFLPAVPDVLLVGGGGSRNRTLLGDLQACMPDTRVQTQEDAGFDSAAKEAVAFAVLANEAVCGESNNVPAATGAAHPVVMGKISQ